MHFQHDCHSYIPADDFSDLFASDKMYGRREASSSPISLSTKQDSRWNHFNACGMTRPGIRKSKISYLYVLASVFS